MADRDDKGSGGGSDWLQELSALRRSTQGVTDTDRQRWEEEAHRSRNATVPTPPPTAEDPWKKLREEGARKESRRRTKIAAAAILAASVGLLIWHNYRLWSAARRASPPPPSPQPTARPSTAVPSSGIVTPNSPRPSATTSPAEVVMESPPPPAKLEESEAARSLALADLELKVVAKTGRPRLVSEADDWSVLEGPAAALAPESASDSVSLARRMLSAKGSASLDDMVRHLANFASGHRPLDQQALILHLGGNPDGALNLLKSAEAGTGDAPATRALRAMCLWARAGPQDQDQALKEVPTAAQVEHDPWAASVSALVLAALGHLDAALDHLAHASAGNPTGAFIRVFLLRLQGNEAAMNVALDAIRKGADGTTARAGAALILASMRLHSGDLPGAEELLQPFEMEQLPPAMKAAVLAALAMASSGLHPSNKRLLRAESLDPQNTWVHLALAKAFANPSAPNLVEAIDHYQAYLAGAPDAATRRTLIAMAIKENMPAVALAELSALNLRGEWTPADRPMAEKAVQMVGKPASMEWLIGAP